MSSPTVPPKRVRITSPRRDARRRVPGRTVRVELTEQTPLGGVYLDSLLKAQRRLVMAFLAATLTAITGLPIAFLALPVLRETMILSIPLPWLVIGAFIYPGLYVAGRIYLWQCERIERDFVDLVEGRS